MLKEVIVKKLEESVWEIFSEIYDEIGLVPPIEDVGASVERSLLLQQVADNICDEVKLQIRMKGENA